jgi:DNA invertase Pin-like site-specific DNA recombinase
MKYYGYLIDSPVGGSVQSQSREAEKFLRRRRRKFEKIFMEQIGNSTSPLTERPRSKELFSELTSGDTVVVLRVEALFLGPDDASRVLREKFSGQLDVSLQIVELGWNATPGGWKNALHIIAGAFQAGTAKKTRARNKASKIEAKKQGRYLGGAPPFGWKVDNHQGRKVLVKRQTTQGIIRKIHNLRHKKLSLRAIAKSLRSEGVQLSHVAVQRILKRSPPSRVLPRIT